VARSGLGKEVADFAICLADKSAPAMKREEKMVLQLGFAADVLF
jgi:hypothetical protein